MGSPYRSAEQVVIVSDEIELQAIDWLAAKKSRLGSRVSVVMMALAAAGGLLLWPLAAELQFALLGGIASAALTVLLAFVVPVLATFMVSLFAGRLLVRLRAPMWLSVAEREFGLPRERMRWVLDGNAPPK